MSPGRFGGQQSPLLPLPRTTAARLQIEGEQVRLKPSAPGDPLILFGDIEASSVPELVTLINSGRRSGVLVVQYDVARKDLTFIDGEVAAVSSNVEDDRVGEVMWRQGLITLDQLTIACEQLGHGKRLGRLLIDNGFIDMRQLYNGLRGQVREVFLSVFLFPRGLFCFSGQVPSGQMQMRLEERTEKLIMDGVLQLDQVSQLRKLIGPPATEIVAAGTPGGSRLSDVESAMFQFLISANKQLTVQQVLDGCRVGELKGLKSIATLLKLGLFKRTVELTEPAPARATADPIGPLIQAINLVVNALQQAGFGADEDVRTFLGDMRIGDQPLLAGPQPEKLLDPDTVRRRAAEIGADAEPVALLLDDALGFCLFQLRETLPREQAIELAEQVMTLVVR